jgi:hypothetical protein
MPRSQKILGYRIDDPTNLRKPSQELSSTPMLMPGFNVFDSAGSAGIHAFIDL